MSLPVRLGSGAQHEVADAVGWYEAQRPGLGERFMPALDGLFNRMAENPRQFPVMESEVRRALLRRFPYAIYFLIAAHHNIAVVAVLHVR